jgi:hypothetical protein
MELEAVSSPRLSLSLLITRNACCLPQGAFVEVDTEGVARPIKVKGETSIIINGAWRIQKILVTSLWYVWHCRVFRIGRWTDGGGLRIPQHPRD